VSRTYRAQISGLAPQIASAGLQQSREQGLNCIKEGKGDREPNTPPDRETAHGGRDEDRSGHWQACPGTQGNQRAYWNAWGGPEDCQTWLNPNNQTKPGGEKVSDARRDSDLDTRKPRLADQWTEARHAGPPRHP